MGLKHLEKIEDYLKSKKEPQTRYQIRKECNVDANTLDSHLKYLIKQGSVFTDMDPKKNVERFKWIGS